METTYIVLIALTVIYIPLFLYVRFRKKPEKSVLEPYGPCIMIRTKAGIRLIDRLGRYKRFWHVCGYASRIITVLLMAYIVGIIILDLILLPAAIGKGGMGIEYALAIPGLNPMLPIVYGWIGLIVAMVMHELSHGMQSRANDIPVDSTGLLYAVVPVGAFVEPNEEEIEKASRGARMDLYAAGITMNFIIAVITFILMFSMAAGTLHSDYDDSPAIYGYTSGSPFIEYDIPTTSVILEIDGVSITTTDQLYEHVDSKGYATDYTIKYRYKDDIQTKTVTLGTYVNGVIKGSPASDIGLEAGDFIIKLGDQIIGSPTSMTDYLSKTHPGDVVSITYYDKSAGTNVDTTITLGDNGGKGYVGITTTLSGVSLTTPSIVLNSGINPYYGRDGLSGYVNGTIGYLANAFNGFSPIPESTQWWYHSSFASDDVFWVLMSLVYWIFWLNIVLGVTNALPAVPFDGGFLFMGGVEWISEKFIRNEEKRKRVVDTICSATTYFMILALILVLVVIIF